jgi:hypothetical protein
VVSIGSSWLSNLFVSVATRRLFSTTHNLLSNSLPSISLFKRWSGVFLIACAHVEFGRKQEMAEWKDRGNFVNASPTTSKERCQRLMKHHNFDLTFVNVAWLNRVNSLSGELSGSSKSYGKVVRLVVLFGLLLFQ